jgi:myo-inositol-1(or 4)-monophosphatase
VDLDQLTYLTIQVAQHAGKTLMASYGHISSDDVKPKTHAQDLITELDRRLGMQIVSELSAITPEADFTEEETDHTDSNSSTRWIIDPIDGTRYFGRNLPMFSIAIAMLHDNNPQIGVIHYPITGQTFYAFKNGGAYRDGCRLQCPAITSLSNAIIYVDVDKLQELTSTERDWIERKLLIFLREFYRVRMFGAGAIAATWMAAGAIHAFVDLTGRNPIWDMAAAQMIMTECGAIHGYFEGKPGAPIYAATHPALWDQLAKILNDNPIT